MYNKKAENYGFKVLQNSSVNPKKPIYISPDVTRLLIRQQELELLANATAEQNKRLVDFTYAITHNIRSHVANMLGIIALNDTGSEEDKEMSWNVIKKSLAGLDETIHNLNEVINIETSQNLPLKKIYIKAELERIIDSIQILFDNGDTVINYHFDHLVSLHTNAAYLESILLNLLTNALKYKSPQRSLQIDISFIHQDHHKVIIFKDNGKGINLNTNGQKIFGLYNTFHGNADARGLGLFITRTQIEALGGKIEVESTVNEYTIFKVYFCT